MIHFTENVSVFLTARYENIKKMERVGRTPWEIFVAAPCQRLPLNQLKTAPITWEEYEETR